MFVRSVEIYEKKDAVNVLMKRIENHPQNPDEFAAFQLAMSGLAGCELDLNPAPLRTPFGPVYGAAELRNARDLAASRQADLALLPVDAGGKVMPGFPGNAAFYRFFKEQGAVELRFTKGADEKAECVAPAEATALAVTKAAVDGQRTAVLVLRSPEAMLYYLGELGRARLEGQYGAKAPADSRFPLVHYRRLRNASAPEGFTLFRLHRGSAADAAVTVEFEGETFSVGRSAPSDRSMHVLSLLTQLFALHNKAAEAPSTANVRLVQ